MKKIFSTGFCKHIILLAFLFIGSVHNIMAQRFAVATGNWSGAIWATTAGGTAGTAATPISTDAVTINSGVTVTVDIPSAKCSTLTFTNSTTSGGVTLSGTDTLNVNGAMTMSAVTTASVTTTMSVGSGTLKTGSISIAGNTVASKKNLISVGANGAVNCTGNFTITAGTAPASAILQWTVATASVTIGGNLSSLGFGELVPILNCNLYLGGNYTFSGSVAPATALNLNLNGTGAQSITGTTTFRSLIVNKASGTATAGQSLTIANNAGINVTSGTLDLSSYAHTMSGAAPAIKVSNGATIEIGGGQTFPTTATAFTLGATSNTIYNGTNQRITATTYGNLSLIGSGNDTVQTLQANTAVATVVAGILNISNGVTLAVDSNFTVDSSTNIGTGTSGGVNFISAYGSTRMFAGLVTVNAGATWNNNVGRACTFKKGITSNGTFTVGGTGAQTFNTNAQALTGNFSMPKVTVTGISLTNNGTLTVSKVLAGTGGLTNIGTLTIDSAATVDTINGKAIGNTVIFGGTVAQTIPGNTYYNVSSTGTGPFTFGVTKSINIENVFNSGTASYITANSSVNFNGTGAQTIPAIKYNNLTISGSGTKLFAGVDTVTGSLSIVSPAIADLGNNNSLANTLTYGNIGQNPGSYGGTGSAATNISSTFFASISTGILNVTTVENSWIGIVSNDWNNPNNWSYGTVPTATTNVSIAGTPPYQPVISDTAGLCNNISISSGDSLTVTNTIDTLYVSGSFANSGKFISAAGTVIFNGKAQIIGSATFYNLTLRSNGLKSIAGDTVNGTLSMEDSAFISPAPVYGAAATLQYNTNLPRNTGLEWITPFTTTGGINVANTGVIKVSAAKVFNSGVLSVQNGATLNDTTRIISGTGTFHLMAGATLELSKATGINGDFTLTTVTLDPMANYVFNNSTAAITAMGTYLTAANNVTIANTLFQVTLSGNVAISGTFSVVPGGLFNVGTNVISGTGNFSLGSGATLKTANATGIDGSITTSGSNYFDPAANYTFNGIVAQTTGLTLPGTVNNISLNNTTGVTLSGSVLVNGLLTFTNGKLTTSSTALLTVNNNLNSAIVTPSSTNYVNGPMVWTMASGTAYIYPIGNNGNYYPFAITPTGVTPQVEVQAINANSGGTSDNITTHYLSSTEYWATSLVSGSVTGATVGITRPTAISPYNVIATSSSASGTYSALHGTDAANSISNSDNVSSLGYYVFASCIDTNKMNVTTCVADTLNGTIYSSSGSYYQTLTNKAGCDSVLALSLTIKQPTSRTLTVTKCVADTLNGQIYTSSGAFIQNLTNKAGCDSTLTLNLTITQPTTSTLTITKCVADTLNGQIYTSSGAFIQNLTNKAGCDSTLTLNLTITQPTSRTLTVTKCVADTLNGQIYASSGAFIQNLTNKAGCDSTLTLNLTITQPTTSTLTITKCVADTLNGQIYTSSGAFIQNLTNKVGCDSTLTLNLTVTQPTTSTLTITKCVADTLNGQIYTSSGAFIQNLTNKAGCDSTLTLNLTVTQPTTSTLTITKCIADTLNGQIYISSGAFIQNLTNKAGCDSTLTLNLTIIQPTTNTLTLTKCVADTLNGQIYTSSGAFIQNLTNKAGCDSTLTLNLTITQPTASTLTVTKCVADTLNGQIYTSSGAFIQNLTNKAGCDSTLTLNLTIIQPTTNTLTITKCVADTLNGQIYTSSGTFIQNLTNKAGCDSTLTLNLTIIQPTTNTLTITKCVADTLNGQIYTSSGAFIQNLTNKAGCDSTLTLNLTIIQPTTNTLTITKCVADTLNGQIYTSSGAFIQNLTNKAGCDSTLTLNLTINQLPVITISGADSIPMGGTDTLIASGATTYTWTSGSTSDSTFVSPSTETTYTVTGTLLGCTNTATFTVNIEILTGISQGNYSNTVNLYPNPTTQLLNLSFEGAKFSTASITIINMQGEEVMNSQVVISKRQSSPIDISSLAAGVYLIKVSTEQGVQTARFIKQ